MQNRPDVPSKIADCRAEAADLHEQAERVCCRDRKREEECASEEDLGLTAYREPLGDPLDKSEKDSVEDVNQTVCSSRPFYVSRLDRVNE